MIDLRQKDDFYQELKSILRDEQKTLQVLRQLYLLMKAEIETVNKNDPDD